MSSFHLLKILRLYSCLGLFTYLATKITKKKKTSFFFFQKNAIKEKKQRKSKLLSEKG